MQELIGKLQKNRLLQNLSQKTIEEVLLPQGTIAEYATGSAVYYTQEKVDRVMMLLSGKVNLVYFMENGNQDLRNILLPPNIVGLDLICTRTQISPYDAVAAESSRIFSFPAKMILEPGFIPEPERLGCINQLLMLLSHINMQKEYRLAILTHHSLRERILVYLTMQANRRQTNTFSIPFTRDEMASFLSVNRSALSHELSILKKEGLIDFHKNQFTLYM